MFIVWTGKKKGPVILNTILVFGEVLFDHFENDVVKRGGAPFNVAWHLNSLGQNVRFFSRVGNDPEGQLILNDMRNRGMSMEMMQTDSDKPTGYVQVTNSAEDPHFAIINDVAYDYITLEKVPVLSPAIIYHGTLAMRHKTSRTTFEQILKSHPGARVFFDVNLRPPWVSIERIKADLKRTTYLKCNESELEFVNTQIYSEKYETKSAAQRIIEDYNVKAVIVTMGDRGASMYNDNGKVLHTGPVPLPEKINSVGAGDAFSAVMITGFISNWPDQITLDRANQFAVRICKIDGAIPDEIHFYNDVLKKW